MKIKRYLTFIFIIFTTFQANRVINNIQTSDAYYITFDSLFAHDLIIQIKDFINQKLKNKKPEEIYKELKNTFPAIKSVIIQRNQPGLLSIEIKAFQPIYIINNSTVFIQNNKFLDLNFYDKEFIKEIKNINIKQKNISPELIEFLNKIPNYIVDEYEVVWENKNIIHLKNTLEKNFTLHINYLNIPSKQIIDECQNIRLNKKNGNQIIADLRFLNQIIISQK